MVAWAQEFFRPLDGRDALVVALQVYFERGLNIEAAANDLFVHHNSLRYRLSKIEELLGINLGDPAAISSTYLALTALNLVGEPHVGQRADVTHPADTDTTDTSRFGEAAIDLRRTKVTDLGVAYGPER